MLCVGRVVWLSLLSLLLLFNLVASENDVTANIEKYESGRTKGPALISTRGKANAKEYGDKLDASFRSGVKATSAKGGQAKGKLDVNNKVRHKHVKGNKSKVQSVKVMSQHMAKTRGEAQLNVDQGTSVGVGRRMGKVDVKSTPTKSSTTLGEGGGKAKGFSKNKVVVSQKHTKTSKKDPSIKKHRRRREVTLEYSFVLECSNPNHCTKEDIQRLRQRLRKRLKAEKRRARRSGAMSVKVLENQVDKFRPVT